MMRTELRLRPPHGQVFLCPKRFIVVVAGRRWGKTTLACWWLIYLAASRPGQMCFYLAPTRRHAKLIAWRKLKELVPRSLCRAIGESELEIELLNGSVIQLQGAFNADGLRGVGLDGIVLDEVAMMRSNVWNEIVRPTLADRRGRAMFIGTPKGHNSFYDLFDAAHRTPDWAAFRFRTNQGGFVA